MYLLKFCCFDCFCSVFSFLLLFFVIWWLFLMLCLDSFLFIFCAPIIDFFFFFFEKAMAFHSSALAWKIPWTEEPGGLQSMGLLRVRHDWATSLSFFTFVHWRRKWHHTPMFLPRESQGWRSLVGYCLWGCTESDTTEVP